MAKINKFISIEYTYWATCVHGPQTAVAAILMKDVSGRVFYSLANKSPGFLLMLIEPIKPENLSKLSSATF